MLRGHSRDHSSANREKYRRRELMYDSNSVSSIDDSPKHVTKKNKKVQCKLLDDEFNRVKDKLVIQENKMENSMLEKKLTQTNFNELFSNQEKRIFELQAELQSKEEIIKKLKDL